MDKIINGLRYGNRKTKSYIIITFLLLAGASGCAVMAVIKKSPLWGMSAVFLGLAVVVIVQSLRFQKTGEVAGKEKPDKERSNRDQGNREKKVRNAEEEETDKEIEQEDERENYLNQYTKDSVKKLFVKYKVNKDHRPIMVDLCQSEKVRQCPAYIWTDKHGLNLLIMERIPRKTVIPDAKATKVFYEKGVVAYPKSDYEAFTSPSFLGMAFGAFLPTLYEDSINGRSIFRKNLYTIAPDIKVTNTSAKAVFDLLQPEFVVEDRVMDSDLYSPYFKSAYKLNILLRDGVIQINEYKQKVKEVLESLADANISLEEFHKNMEQLVKGRMITEEYADYYMEYRLKRK
ncbi:MAG: hypothetical protein E7256_12120 [Lachnospiraceae bacterium]|nr:hypothetical protein [Lachnospiraceae bacterium]